MTPYNEREVLKLLQEESTQRKGFELIVAQYSEQLYWQIRRMVLSHEDANDLLQNTFIKAWTNIDYFRAEAKLSTWLYRIALNECLTFTSHVPLLIRVQYTYFLLLKLFGERWPLLHSPKGLEELFAPLLSFFCKTLAYKVFFHEFEK